MKIRTMNMEDLDQVMRIYENAREYMIKEGNANQWDKGYPSKEAVLGGVYFRRRNKSVK